MRNKRFWLTINKTCLQIVLNSYTNNNKNLMIFKQVAHKESKKAWFIAIDYKDSGC